MSETQDEPPDGTPAPPKSRPFVGDPWARQPDESPKAYNDFLAYRDLGPGRSFVKAASLIGDKVYFSQTHKSYYPGGKWPTRASAHRWRERCDLWDRHLQAERDRAKLAAIARQAAIDSAKWEERKADSLDAYYFLSVKMRNKADAMLDSPLHETEEEIDEAAGMVRRTVKPAKWNFKTAADLAIDSATLVNGAMEAATRALEACSPEELLAIADAMEGGPQAVKLAGEMTPVAEDVHLDEPPPGEWPAEEEDDEAT